MMNKIHSENTYSRQSAMVVSASDMSCSEAGKPILAVVDEEMRRFATTDESEEFVVQIVVKGITELPRHIEKVASSTQQVKHD